jgi:hypothetical protein
MKRKKIFVADRLEKKKGFCIFFSRNKNPNFQVTGKVTIGITDTREEQKHGQDGLKRPKK